MLLLHMSVESGIAKIRLIAVLALEVASVDIVLRPALRFVLVVTSAATVLRVIIIRSMIRGTSSEMRWCTLANSMSRNSL
jgi:hypothetical protein